MDGRTAVFVNNMYSTYNSIPRYVPGSRVPTRKLSVTVRGKCLWSISVCNGRVCTYSRTQSLVVPGTYVVVDKVVTYVTRLFKTIESATVRKSNATRQEPSAVMNN